MMQLSSKVNRRSFLKILAVTVPVVGACEHGDKTDIKNTCKTTADILGPYYKSGAPENENIIPEGVETPPLFIQGKVYSNCGQLLADAVVEIWNANEDGVYDLSDEFLFRGKYKTTGDGLYRFKTIVPGRYLNGATYRPSHIHFRITAPGHTDLVSQVYFENDPFIDDDPWASDPKAEERILIITKDNDNVDTVNFDIHLSIAE